MFLQQVINGLTIGGVYALIALGYTMVYGIIELINFAHGEIYMVGAYAGIIVLAAAGALGISGLPIPALIACALAGAMLICGAFGYTMERIAYRPLRNAPRLSPLISALGMSIFLQNFIMIAQGTRDKVFPHILSYIPPLQIGNARISLIQIAIIILCVILMAALQLFINHTRVGTAMRATAQDKTAAALSGINVDRIISITFIIGSLLAGAAGVMVAMYYGLVNYYIGYVAGIKAFTAAVLGGIGNIPGAMLGGFLLGLFESFGAGYISGEFKDVFAFALLILVLLFKPSGLLGETVTQKI
jgi:branched-chain amino acid transport system permease protein